MNPLFETFVSFLIWADTRASARASPDQVFGVNSSRIMSRMSRFLPHGATRLCSGLAELMLFECASWEEALQRMAETSANLWREAISPPGTPPDRILHAISNPAGGFQLIADLGMTPDPGLGALYGALLGHPKTLKQDILAVLQDAWSLGFKRWCDTAVQAGTMPPPSKIADTPGIARGVVPQSAGGRPWIMTLSPAMLESGEITLRLRSGTLILVPYTLPHARPTEGMSAIAEVKQVAKSGWTVDAAQGPQPDQATQAAPAAQGATGARREVLGAGGSREPRVFRSRGEDTRNAASASPAMVPEDGARAAIASDGSGQGIASVRVPGAPGFCDADVAVFRALADPTRLRVMEFLALGPSYPSVIADHLGVSLPTMSHHLAALRAAGLISVKKSKGYAELTLATVGLESTSRYLRALMTPPAERE